LHRREQRGVKVTEEEHVKQAGLFLDFDEVAQKGTMSKEEVLVAKWYGIYRSRQTGDHMARIVICSTRSAARTSKSSDGSVQTVLFSILA